jgi:predicted nuclease of restriction endonuclease-like (RecB) superfamily
MNKDYQMLLSDIKNVLRSGQAKAIRQLSRAVIESYWDVGKHITESQQLYGWGKNIVEQLSHDLKKEFPNKDGFSARNLWDMRRFYLTYYEYSNLRHVVAEIPWGLKLMNGICWSQNKIISIKHYPNIWLNKPMTS